MNVNDMVAALAAKTVDADGQGRALQRDRGSRRHRHLDRATSSSVDKMPVFMAATPDFVDKNPDAVVQLSEGLARRRRATSRSNPKKVADVIYTFFTSKGYKMSSDTFSKALAASRSIRASRPISTLHAAAGRDAAQGKEDRRHPGLEEGAASATSWRRRAPARSVRDGPLEIRQRPAASAPAFAHAYRDLHVRRRPNMSPDKTRCASKRRDPIDLEFQAARATTSSPASAAWARACRSRSPRTAAASSGSRMKARRRISPPSTCPTRASRRSWCRPTCRSNFMRSNSLEVVGDIMAVAYQCQKVGQKPAGFELFDISVPEKPKSIAFFDASGPHSRGVHQLWFCDGEYVHMASGAPISSRPIRRTTSATRFSTCAIRRSRSRSAAGGCPARARATTSPPPARHSRRSTWASAPTTPMSIRRRPDRCYLGYIDGGMFIIDITDKSKPQADLPLGQFAALHGFTHTVLPLFDRDLLRGHRRVDVEDDAPTGRS